MSPHLLGEKWLWQLVTQPALLEYAVRRLGTPDVVLWHTDILAKLPASSNDADGGAVAWHQDQMYWQGQGITGPVAGIWLPFDDVEPSNGTMAVLPRWHRMGLLPKEHTGEEVEGIPPGGDFFGCPTCSIRLCHPSPHDYLFLHNKIMLGLFCCDSSIRSPRITGGGGHILSAAPRMTLCIHRHAVQLGVLPKRSETDLEDGGLRQTYRLLAGQAACHSNLLPHRSFRETRWLVTSASSV